MSHHYGEDSSSLTVGPKNYILQFHNKITDKTIRMVIPREGSGPTRRSRVKEEKIYDVLYQTAHLLRTILG